ncbi:MAG TPA: Ig-like domain-containing protein [Candidatus Paceibacterota bacterium]|nr:Ig-like domain-containing protein [Candidatus Paceibacterota bacterium]
MVKPAPKAVPRSSASAKHVTRKRIGIKSREEVKRTSKVIPTQSLKKTMRRTPTHTSRSKINQNELPKKLTLARLEGKRHVVKISNNTKKVVETKLHNSTLLSKKKRQSRKGGVLMKRPEFRVSIPSITRFPVIQNITISQFSRTAGMVVLLIGAFLTSIHFGFINNNSEIEDYARGYRNTASLIATSSPEDSGELTDVDETPSANIRIDGQVPLHDIVPIIITVPSATNVTVYAKHIDTSTTHPLGTAHKVNDLEWQISWDTHYYLNGEYRISVNISNSFGSYNQGFSETYTVHNELASVLDQAPSDSDSNNDTSTSTRVSLTIDEPSPLRGDVSMKLLSSTDASKVTIYALNKLSGTQFLIGNAIKKSIDEWRYVLNSETLNDGTYYFFAKGYYQDNIIESNKVTRTVDNVDEILDNVTDAVVASSTTTIATEGKTPQVSVSLSKQSPLSNFVEISLFAPLARKIELYHTPNNSLREIFIGTAFKISDTTWKYAWNTNNSPNGEYILFARVKNEYGEYTSDKTGIRIFNVSEIEYTPEQEELIEEYRAVDAELTKTTQSTPSVSPANDADDAEGAESVAVSDKKVTYIQSVEDFTQSLNSSLDEGTHTSTEVKNLILEYRNKLNEYVTQYAHAIRTNDTDATRALKSTIESFQSDTISKLSEILLDKNLIDSINTYVSQLTFNVLDTAENNERIIADRLANRAHIDSDNDGILDFDEINLYKTNPFVADTDTDGFSDGAEIARGYDPNNPEQESLLAYESAKESGIVRDDVLSIASISTIHPDSATGTPKALITGKALPHSFINLYIYSTPIVVSVKTDAEGSWSYIFDKEIEDGDHEIYVGITDNTGAIVAKSAAFPFVKTAEAFAQTNPFVNDSFSELTPSFLTGNMLLLIASISIVSLGLVLMLLGMYATNRKLPKPIDNVTL